MSKPKRKILLALVVLIGLSLASAFFYGKSLIAAWAHRKAETVLQTKVEFSDLSFNLSSRSVTLRNLSIYHPDRKNEKIGEIPEMIARLESPSDLFHKIKPVEIFLEHPKILFITTRSGDWELSDRIPLLRRGTSEMPLAPFDIDRITVDDGSLEFRDGRVGTTSKLSKIQFHADHFSPPTAEDRLPVPFDAHFMLGNSGKIEMKGEGDFLSPKTSFKAELKAEGLPLPPYAPYYEAGLPVHVRSGAAYFTTQVQCDQDVLRIPIHASVSDLKVELKEHKNFAFVADYKLDSMKNDHGMVETDLMVSGDLRRPRISFLTKFDASFSTGMKAVGHKIKSGFGKFKDFFSKK